MRRLIGLTCAWLLFTVPLSASGSATRPVDYHDYSTWKSIRDVTLERSARWAAYALVPAMGDSELYVRALRAATEYHQSRGREPVFSADGTYVAFRIAPPDAEVRVADRDETPDAKRPKSGLGIMNLATGTVIRTERVRSFSIAREANVIAALIEPSPAPSASPAEKATAAASPAASATAAAHGPGKAGDGTLIVQPLGGVASTPIENVTDYSIAADGSRVAYVVQTTADERLVVRELANTHDVIVATGVAHLRSPVFSPDGRTIAFLRDPDAYNESIKRETGARHPNRLVLSDAATGATIDVPLGTLFTSDAQLPQFSDDGKKIAFLTTDVPKPLASGAPKRIDLDMWYARSGKLPTQLRREAADPMNATYRALYDRTSGKTTQLATPSVPNVAVSGDASAAFGFTSVPYEKEATWAEPRVDIYRIDVTTGARTLLARNIQETERFISPDGAFVAAYDPHRRSWFRVRLTDGSRAEIGAKRVRAEREDDDHPGEPPAYGAAGWTAAGRFVFYDRYDVWSAADDGSSLTNLTRGEGRSTKRMFRLLDPRSDLPTTAFVSARPVSATSFTVFDERTKDAGFATLDGTRLVVGALEPALIARPSISRDGSQLVFTKESFGVPPDLFTSGPSLVAAQRISQANPPFSALAWGHARLIDYTNARGEKLRATLILPANFNPKSRYPMLVYVYEKLSDDLNTFYPPATGTIPTLSRYASNGYIVLMPDIRYHVGHTSASAVDCVTSAIDVVEKLGFVDAKRIGMAGHSYGGYEVNALVTHSNVFRAVESGASDSNLVSLYGGFWESGDVQQSYYEVSQGRIGATPWARPDLYTENSPIYFVGRVKTPYLRLQNTNDGAVPYAQGVEFFSALRRAGKEAYMFSFIGEQHGLVNQRNKDYWTVHMDEYFDYFLLGAARPSWLDEPSNFERRGERNIETLFTPR